MEPSTGTVGKALDVLFLLHRLGALGSTAVARELSLPKSTAHRLLGSLADRGMVERDDSGQWRPGIGLVALGLGVLEREPVVAAARPALEAGAAELGETLFLAGARGGRIVVLDKEEGRGFLRATPRVGEEIPAHATAIGKLYLAFAPDRVELPAALRAYTRRTRARRAPLEREVARTRGRGWAENREEWLPGLVGVAAPVLVRDRMIAAVAVSGPASRMQPALRARFVREVKRAASRIADRLSGADLRAA